MNYFAVRVVLSIFGSFTYLIVYKITRELFDQQVALIAAFISSIYWMMFYWCGFLLTETLCTFFLTLTVFYFIKSAKYHRLRHFILGGMYLGLAALTQPSVFPFFILLPFLAFASFRNNLKLALKGSLVVLFSTFLTILPWIIRNYLVVHKFTHIISQSGQVFLGANNPEVLKHFKGGCIYPTKSSLFQKEEIQHYRE